VSACCSSWAGLVKAFSYMPGPGSIKTCSSPADVQCPCCTHCTHVPHCPMHVPRCFWHCPSKYIHCTLDPSTQPQPRPCQAACCADCDSSWASAAAQACMLCSCNYGNQTARPAAHACILHQHQHKCCPLLALPYFHSAALYAAAASVTHPATMACCRSCYGWYGGTTASPGQSQGYSDAIEICTIVGGEQPVFE
jgi:hypothetical protein